MSNDNDTGWFKFRFTGNMWPSLLIIMFVTCAATGTGHAWSCGFDRDYLGDVIDIWGKR